MSLSSSSLSSGSVDSSSATIIIAIQQQSKLGKYQHWAVLNIFCRVCRLVGLRELEFQHTNNDIVDFIDPGKLEHEYYYIGLGLGLGIGNFNQFSFSDPVKSYDGFDRH
ncbi:hypothetical protein PG994_000580 [Apiospora phragmitis]|uniref:Uncharacterized protein n=1 Tax=Apiospora phragmitis TaxID=2905665 RepID=A0ABR1X6P2_9PEZI